MDLLLAFASLALKASVVLVAAAAIAWMLARGSAALRHRVWTLAVAGLLVLPVLQVFAPKLPVVDLTAARLAAPVRSATEGANSRAAAKPGTIRDAERPTAVARGAATLIGGLPASGTPSGAPAPPSAWSPARLAAVLTWVWAIGAALVLGFFAAGRVALARLARASRPLEDPSWRASASDVAASLGIRRSFRLVVSAQATAPMTWGTWRPILLLPDTAAQWAPAQRRAILVHELAHLARFDCAIQQAAQLACALYWFHPGAWYAAHRLRVEREPACDDRVLADGASASAYATQLLDAVRAAKGGGGLFAVSSAAMAAPSRLHERVRALLDPAVDRRPVARGSAVAAGALAIALVTFVAVLAPKSARDAEAGDTKHAPPTAKVAATPAAATDAAEAPIVAEPPKEDAAPGLAGRWDRTVEEARVAYKGRAFWIVYAVPPGATRLADESLLSDSEGWNSDDLTRRGKSLAERFRFANDDAVFLFRVPASGKAKGPGFDRVAIRGAEMVPEFDGLPVVSLGRADVDESLSWMDRRLAETPDDARARVLVTAISLHDTPRTLVSLQSLLNSERKEETRAQSAEGLVRHPSQRSLDVLVEHARSDASAKVSAECAESIGDLDLPQATEELIDLALDLEDESVRQEAVESLGQKDPGRVIATLIVVTREDPSETVRREAVETLGDLGDEGELALRRVVSKSSDPAVRSEAAETLQEVAERKHSGKR